MTSVADVIGTVRDRPGLNIDEVMGTCGCTHDDIRRAICTGRVFPTDIFPTIDCRLYVPGAAERVIPCNWCIPTFDEPERIRVLDTETTGLDPSGDGILQVAVIDGNGRTLFESYVHPYERREWPKAERVNGISPEMVRDAPSMAELRPDIDRALKDAELIIGYNVGFDLSFLRSKGVTVPAVDTCDVMRDFAYIYGEWADWADDGWVWQSLVTCADYYGYRFDAHDALEDARATLHCCRRIMWDLVDGRRRDAA